MKLLLLLSDEAQIAHRSDVELKRNKMTRKPRLQLFLTIFFFFKKNIMVVTVVNENLQNYAQFSTPFGLVVQVDSEHYLAQNSLGTKIFHCLYFSGLILTIRVRSIFLCPPAYYNNMLSFRWSKIIGLTLTLFLPVERVVLESSGRHYLQFIYELQSFLK